jgi:hypothetical protein
MSLSNDKPLIPGEALIYEDANGVVYARYRDPPHSEIERWIVGGDPVGIAKAQGKLFDYSTWQDMMEESDNNPILKKYLQKAIEAFYITKENK